MLGWARTHRLLLIGLGLTAVVAAVAVPVVWRQTRPADQPLPLTTLATVGLPGRATRFDYAEVDPAAHRLFVAHMDDGVLLAIDTRTDRVVATVSDLPSVTGVIVVPALHRVFASAAGAGQVVTIDEDTATVLARAPAGQFPDGLAYVPSTGQVWVSDESGSAETVLDAATGRAVATVPLGGEAGNVRYDPASDRVLVAVQTGDRIAVVDPHTHTVTAHVRVPGCDHGHGLIVTAGRAWVACDGNDELIVLALPQLTELGRLAVGGRPDVLAADPARGLLYVAAESGDVISVDTRPSAGRVTARPPGRRRARRRRRPDHRPGLLPGPGHRGRAPRDADHHPEGARPMTRSSRFRLVPRVRPGRDASLLIAGQAVRAAGYGFTAVLLGALLAARGFSHLRAGVVLTALIAGTALSSLVVGALADRVGRRRSYAVFFLGVAVVGGVVAAGVPFWALLVVALTGTLSTDVVDNGPATTLEQAMLAADDAGTASVYGLYNAVGAAAGALGALAAALPGPTAGVSGWWFAVLVPVGLLGAGLAWRLSPQVEAGGGPLTLADAASARSRLGPSRRVVYRLAGLFAVDAGGGGLVTTGFLAYYLAQRYAASVSQLGRLFFTVAAIQAVSVAIAPRLARRFGLVATMVGTHLPSNVLLAAVAFAPSFPVVGALLLARTCLSQMDVPTRQALVMSVVTPGERTMAAAVTNAARYTVRPIGPLVAGAVQQLGLGAPLLLAGVVKGGYDVALWRWARRAGVEPGPPATTIGGTADAPAAEAG